MKKILILTALMFLALTSVSAQPRKISSEEYTEMMKKNAELRKGKSYRLTRMSESYKKSDGSLIHYFKEVTEDLPSGDSHSVVESGRSKGNLPRLEHVRIGQTAYQRGPDGNWSQSPLRIRELTDEEKREGEKKRLEYEARVERFYVGKTTFRNQNAELYESRDTTKIMKNGVEVLTKVVTKMWFTPEGLILRNEEQVDNAETTETRVFDFEYDPTIKIEAPIK